MLSLGSLSAQADPQGQSPAVRPEGEAPAAAPAEPFPVGRTLPAPRAFEAAAPDSRRLACQIVCSPFDPRQSIAQISWPEGGPSAEAQGEAGARSGRQGLRLDIVGSAGSFEDGDYGTLRVAAVPLAQAGRSAGIDLEAARTAAPSVPFQPVVDHRVVARDPALPAPKALISERIPGVREGMPAGVQEALERDARGGGIGRMHALAQAVETQPSGAERTVVVQGMQPGLTYKIRLVQEAEGAADNLAQSICRVPVCPADFMQP